MCLYVSLAHIIYITRKKKKKEREGKKNKFVEDEDFV